MEILRRWMHKKRKSRYTEIGRAILQYSAIGPAVGPHPVDGVELVLYQSDIDGKITARPYFEFHDGRFENIGSITEADHKEADWDTLKDCYDDSVSNGDGYLSVANLKRAFERHGLKIKQAVLYDTGTPLIPGANTVVYHPGTKRYYRAVIERVLEKEELGDDT